MHVDQETLEDTSLVRQGGDYSLHVVLFTSLTNERCPHTRGNAADNTIHVRLQPLSSEETSTRQNTCLTLPPFIFTGSQTGWGKPDLKSRNATIPGPKSNHTAVQR